MFKKKRKIDIYSANIQCLDGIDANFKFTKVSNNKQFFVFIDEIYGISRVYFIKDIKAINMTYIGKKGEIK